jgi:predicted O-linked N-acetylglucosamine transferase (SPINDLY family)
MGERQRRVRTLPWMEEARGFAAKRGGQAAELVKSLSKRPGDFVALHNLGVLAFEARSVPLSLQLLKRAAQLTPANAMCHGTLAAALELSGDREGAQRELNTALRLAPGCAEPLYNFAVALRHKRHLREAASCFERALKMDSGHLGALNNLGLTCLDAGNVERAVSCFEEVLRRRPGTVMAMVNLSSALNKQGKAKESEQLLRKALEIEPENPDALNNLANLLIVDNRLVEALEVARRAVAAGPRHAESHIALGTALSRLGRLEEALPFLKRALDLDPQSTECHQAMLFNRHYWDGMDAYALAAEHRRWAECFAPPLYKGRRYRNVPDPERRLRIGFVSADFRTHPVSFFLAPIFELHDRDQVELVCYASGKEDGMTSRLKCNVPLWRRIDELDDPALDKQIEDDGIDILVDLAGHTAGGRLAVFARKPAPVEMTWLGYFNTTGVEAIDYILVDPIVAPPHEKPPFVEKLLCFEGCYLAYQPPAYAPAVNASPFLTNGYVTYGCFNAISKLAKPVLETWGEILRQNPTARLALKDRAFDHVYAREKYTDYFGGLGIDTARLILLGQTTPGDTLAAWQQIDIALDPFPYNGGTTTCEALAMGVPVVTLHGNKFVSRVGTTILANAGLPELISNTREEYIFKAVELGRSLDGLAELRKTMRDILGRSTLWDVAGFTRKMEHGYREIWRRWCQTQRG